MKKVFFIFVIIIILITGIYFVIRKPSTQPAQSTDTREQSSEQAQIKDLSGKNVQNNTESATNTEQTSSAEKTSKIVVNYTDNGFNPSSLEIKKDQTVQFVNQSSDGMWVASGPHPAHTNYPEFDAKKNIPSGEIYEFTFAKVGEWKYHNHVSSGKFGSVTVK